MTNPETEVLSHTGDNIMVVYCQMCGEDFTVETSEELEHHAKTCIGVGSNAYPPPPNSVLPNGMCIDIMCKWTPS